MSSTTVLYAAGGVSDVAKQQLKILKYILRAFMLRRTKALLVESGILMLPPLTEITVLDSPPLI